MSTILPFPTIQEIYRLARNICVVEEVNSARHLFRFGPDDVATDAADQLTEVCDSLRIILHRTVIALEEYNEEAARAMLPAQPERRRA